jgi:hypothetical protein
MKIATQQQGTVEPRKVSEGCGFKHPAVQLASGRSDLAFQLHSTTHVLHAV